LRCPLRLKPGYFNIKATGVDTSRILETEMGYECHSETDQGMIARERLEERLPKRKIHVQVRDHLHDVRRK
jgi:hypothetical protein